MILSRRWTREEFAEALTVFYEKADRALRALTLHGIIFPELDGAKERVRPTSVEWDPLSGVVEDDEREPHTEPMNEAGAFEADFYLSGLSIINPWGFVRLKAANLEGEWEDVMARGEDPG